MAKLTGTNPDQVPTNADLGDMAYKDGESLQAGPLTIKDGKVGVGTTSPSTLLHLQDTAPVLAVTAENNSSGLRINAIGQTGGELLRVQQDGSTQLTLKYGTGEVQVTSGLLELDGNDIGGTQVTIADDAVASITPPRKGGFMFVTCQGNNDFPQTGNSGLFWYDVGGSLSIFAQPSSGIGGGLDASTSDVTGTTGTDGSVTVAVQTGVIKIENRNGSSGTFQITFL